MRTLNDIKTDVLVKLGASTTLAYYTDTILGTWISDAHKWAAAHHKWPFTEGRVSTTFATGSGTNSDEYSFEGYKADSFRFLKVGTKRFQKLNFEDYQNYLEKNPAGTDKVYSDFGRLVYINPNTDASGTLVAYGQFTPADLDITGNEATIFSDFDNEGNEAIASEVISYAKMRENKPQESTFYHTKALEILENMWKRHGDEQAMYQTKNRGMYERFDVILGDYQDEIFREDRFF